MKDSFPPTFNLDYNGLNTMAEEGYEPYRLFDDYVRKYRTAK